MPIMLERCRLCQVNIGTVKITDSKEFINQVFECTKIELNDTIDLLPQKVCTSCKVNVEVFFAFVQEIRNVDRNLQYGISELQKPPPSIETVKLEADSNRLKCPVCPKTYRRSKNLECHKRTHMNLCCRKCKRFFNDPLKQKSHVCIISNDILVERDIKPLDSGKDITDVNLNSPINMLDNKDLDKEWSTDAFSIDKKESSNGNHVCDTCRETFAFSTDLRLHQKVHGIRHCTYENCSKVCTSVYSLRTHLMRHEGKMPFLCVTCGKGFTTKNSLNCHEKTHAKIKGYVCKECNIGFSVASNLRAHQKKHHEGVRFYCSQCTRAFITKSSLERHELVHAGVKEFKCASCRAAFYTNKELLKHQRYHQGLRLYKCDQCFKTFFEKHHLTIHIRVHTGERPYACKVTGCGKSFTESQKLSRHMKARHPPLL